MKAIKTRLFPQCFDPGVMDLVPVRVVGVYCDMPAYLTATHQLQNIANRCPSICRFNSHWWSFESLNEPQVREVAARAATEADMIWCAACVCKPLPDMIKAWVEEWLARAHKPDAALVALLRYPLVRDTEQSPISLCLYSAARASGMEFFEKRFHCACEHGATERIKASPAQFAGNQAVFGQPNRPVVDWGINE